MLRSICLITSVLIVQAIPQWKTYFDNPSSSQLGLATASVFFPAVVTAFVGDWISARWGRKWGIRLGATLIVRLCKFASSQHSADSFVQIAGSFVNAFAQNWPSECGWIDI